MQKTGFSIAKPQPAPPQTPTVVSASAQLTAPVKPFASLSFSSQPAFGNITMSTPKPQIPSTLQEIPTSKEQTPPLQGKIKFLSFN